MRSWGWLAMLALMPAPAMAVDFFVCDCAAGADPDCVPGDDTSPGTQGAPWQTYERARVAFASLQPGDAIRFCDGGVFPISAGSHWVNTQCRAGNRCLVSNYAPPWGSGDEGRPVIEGNGGHGFALENGGNAVHEEGYVIENLELRSPGGGWGFFLYNDVDDVEIRNVHVEGFDIGVHLAGSNPCSADPLCDGKNERLVLRDSTIVGNAAQGWLGSSSGSQILGCTFDSNGDASILDHNIYISGSSGEPTQGIRVIGNQLHASSQGGGGSCLGTSLVVHGEHADLVIEGNLVWEDPGTARPTCWGIAVDPAYASSEAFLDVVIRGNVVRNVGNLGIGVASCQRCLIENNVVIQENGFGFTGIAAPNRPRATDDLPLDEVTVRNNSVWLTGGGGVGIAVGGEGGGHAVVSNALLHEGGPASWSCFAFDLPASAYDAIDHGACFAPNAMTWEWAQGAGAMPTPLQAWQSSGFDASSREADPAFADPGRADLSIAETSPLVDTGHPTLSSPSDLGGWARDSSPDIGAHEWVVAPLIYLSHFRDTSVTHEKIGRRHDLIRGLVSNLRVVTDVDLGPVECVGAGNATALFVDVLPGAPPDGDCFFYLLRPAISSRAYGSSSDGRPRWPASGDCP